MYIKMLYKEHNDKKTAFFVNNNKSSKVDKEPKTSRVNNKNSAYDRVVQLVTNDTAETESKQQPQGQEQNKVHIIV